MFKRHLLAASIIAGSIGIGAYGAYATVATPQAAPIIEAGGYIPADVVVKKKLKKKHSSDIRKSSKYNKKGQRRYNKSSWVYNSGRHGQRYRHRQNGYNHHYNGYYYAQPWWNVTPGIIIQIN